MSQALQSTGTGIAAPPMQLQNLSDMYSQRQSLPTVRNPQRDSTPHSPPPEPSSSQEGEITITCPSESMSLEEFFETFYQANFSTQRTDRLAF
jgi:hypothetical protein